MSIRILLIEDDRELGKAVPKSGKVMLRIRGENTVPHSIVTGTCEGGRKG